MGKLKKGYNWKARQVVNTSIIEQKNTKVHIQLENETSSKYDDCNALVLPSKKRKTKLVKPSSKPVAKTLSKKQRKHLEKIVERKKKKENRSNLLDALSKVQVPDDVLNQLTSITEVQTRGVKRLRETEDGRDNVNSTDVSNLLPYSGGKKKAVINSISGSKRRGLIADNSKSLINDPNIVGFELSDNESEFEENNEEEEEDNYNLKDVVDRNVKGAVVNQQFEINDSAILSKLNNNNNSRTNNDSTMFDSCSENNSLLNNSLESNKNHSFIKDVFKNKWTVTQCDATKVSGDITSTDDKHPCSETNSGEEKANLSKPAVFVPVNRKLEIQEARLKLPILSEEQAIMEAISENSIVIIAGETGSGKTTQVPQFLYEAGYALGGRMIGITEPRRVAAISMSQRVGEELNLASDKVSYLIRFEGNVTPDTQVKFMTDGVLLKEIQTDFLLTKYSAIILDEAHERSVYTDILIGFLSRIVPLRIKRNNPLKLIIMSATLRISDFTENKRLFKITPPVIKVDSRQYPVSIHFNKRTNPDYVREAYRKAFKIHTQLPEGGILIFVTGQQEVNTLVKKLRNAFPLRKQNNKTSEDEKEDVKGNKDDDVDVQLDETLQKRKRIKKKQAQICLPEIDLNKYSLVPNDDTEGDAMDEDIKSDDDLEDEDDDEYLGGNISAQPLWVLPLYSLLPSHKQAKVFRPPPEGCRLCVVATNIAETSLTIPHIKYVVDSGKVKTKVYDKHTGVSAFTIVWTSKAAANQRAGRAGRTGPGHCYRLYSSAVFNDEFEQWSVPEIQKQPVDDLVLQLKAIGINKVANFPFPSPPDIVQLNAAGRRLSLLGALPPQSLNAKNADWSSKLTKLGEAMSIFPVSPRFAKMLCLSHQHNLMEYTITVVAALSVQELLLLGDKEWAKTRRKWAGVGNSFLLGDIMVLMRAAGASECANANGSMEKFCEQNGLRLKAVLEVRKLRLQLTKEINLHAPELNLFVNPKMPPPTDQQAKQLRQIVLAGLVDQVAKRVPNEEAQEAGVKKGKAVYRTMEMEEFVYIHPNSALYKEQPEWVVYQQVSEMSKLYMTGLTAIEPQWLPIFAPSLCNLTHLSEPPPRYDTDTGTPYCMVSGTFGRGGWKLPDSEMEFPSGVDRYRWFAVFILDGSVCPKLEKYSKCLLSNPSTMTRSWSRLIPRTNMLLKSLVDKEVSSKSTLLECWSQDSKYLLSDYLSWLPESVHNEVITLWPPVD